MSVFKIVKIQNKRNGWWGRIKRFSTAPLIVNSFMPYIAISLGLSSVVAEDNKQNWKAIIQCSENVCENKLCSICVFGVGLYYIFKSPYNSDFHLCVCVCWCISSHFEAVNTLQCAVICSIFILLLFFLSQICLYVVWYVFTRCSFICNLFLSSYLCFVVRS